MHQIRTGALVAIVLGILLIFFGAIHTGGTLAFWAFWIWMGSYGLEWLLRKD